MNRESPIFTKSGELLRWLAAATRRFPRDQRFAMAARVLDQVFDLEDRLVAAAVDRAGRACHLLRADIALASLRRTLQHCNELGLLSDRQLLHAAELTREVGRLLGAWRKSSS